MHTRKNIFAWITCLVLALLLGVVGCTNGGSSSTSASSSATASASTSSSSASSATASSSSSTASSSSSSATSSSADTTSGVSVTEDGTYTSKDEVAAYIHTFGHLPSNYITKSEARDEGWVSSEGNLAEVCPGMSIGGDRFYNNEGNLPSSDDSGGSITYRECDIDYKRGRRNAKRIIYGSDGSVYYTEDHYSTFEQLY